jgi:hypothetical protein
VSAVADDHRDGCVPARHGVKGGRKAMICATRRHKQTGGYGPPYTHSFSMHPVSSVLHASLWMRPLYLCRSY